MKALVQTAYGSAAQLELRDVPVPEPLPGEVRVRVRAASVNRADWLIVTGEPLIARLAFGLPRPKREIRGQELAGVIDAVGAGVTRFTVGDAVFGELAGGAFAEFVCAPEGALAAKPAGVSFEQAACLSLAGGTALQGLELAGLRAGQSILINGASGGVGTFAIQLARSLGAEVTAVCSAPNVEQATALGAARVIDYGQRDATAGPERYDAILDIAGTLRLSRLRRILAPGGTLVLASGNGSRLLGPLGAILRASIVNLFVRERLVPLVASPDPDRLRRLAGMVEEGQLAPVIERTFPLDDAQAAVAVIGAGHARGKTVITVA